MNRMAVPILAGVSLAIIAWSSVWGFMDLLIHTWTNRQKFWWYTALLLSVGVIVWIHPDVLEYF